MLLLQRAAFYRCEDFDGDFMGIEVFNDVPIQLWHLLIVTNAKNQYVCNKAASKFLTVNHMS